MAIGTPKRNRTSYLQSKVDQRKSTERRSSVQYSLLGLGIGFDDLDDDNESTSAMSTPSTPSTPIPTQEADQDETPSFPADTAHFLSPRKSSKRRSSVRRRRSSCESIVESLSDAIKAVLDEEHESKTEAARRASSRSLKVEDFACDASTETLEPPTSPLSSPVVSTPKKLKKKKSSKDVTKSPKTPKKEYLKSPKRPKTPKKESSSKSPKSPKKSKAPKSPKTPKNSKKAKKKAKSLEGSEHTLRTVASEGSIHSSIHVTRLSDPLVVTPRSRRSGSKKSMRSSFELRNSFMVPTSRISSDSFNDSFCLDDDLNKSRSSVTFADFSEMAIVNDLCESAHLDDLYWREEELAGFRHKAFLEDCGVDPEEFGH